MHCSNHGTGGDDDNWDRKNNDDDVASLSTLPELKAMGVIVWVMVTIVMTMMMIMIMLTVVMITMMTKMRVAVNDTEGQIVNQGCDFVFCEV